MSKYRTPATVVTQYRDPLTGALRTVATCDEHTDVLLRLLKAAHTGCGSTTAPALFDCEACVTPDGAK